MKRYPNLQLRHNYVFSSTVWANKKEPYWLFNWQTVLKYVPVKLVLLDVSVAHVLSHKY